MNRLRGWTRRVTRTLVVRMVLAVALLMTTVLAGFAAYTNHQERQILFNTLQQQGQALTHQLAAASANYLLTENYAELEALALRLVEYPAVEGITILDARQSPVLSVRADGSTARPTEGARAAVPAETDGPIFTADTMQVWRTIEVGQRIGWVYLEYSLKDYHERLYHTWLNTAIAVGVALLLGVLILPPFFQHNIRLLHAATDFAHRLVEGKGETLPTQSRVLEISNLVTALNEASLTLHDKNRRIEQSAQLLHTIHRVQSGFIAATEPHQLFKQVLEDLLALTGCEFGFIAEVLHQTSGRPYLKTHAISNIAWNAQTEKLYADNAVTGFEFYNLDTLFGEVVRTAQPLLTNDPGHHPKRGGLPGGHPPLSAFLGAPFFNGPEMVGMIGLANRPGGFDEALLTFLQPLLSTCGQVLDAYRSAAKRALMEEQLKHSENMLRQVLNTIPTRVFWKDLDGVYKGCNYNFAQDAGFMGEEAVFGKTDYQMPWSSEATLYRHDDKQVINSGIPKLRFEEPQTTPEGQRIWLRSNKIPLRDLNDEVIGILGSYDVITEEKEKEVQLRESEARLAAAQRIAQLGNWESDLRTGRDLWSTETFRILSLDPETDLPSFDRFVTGLHPEDAARVSALVAEHEARKEPYEFEARLSLPDQAEKTVFIRTEFDLDGDDNIRRIYGTIQDITERKRMEKMKDEFISTVSHELRTPLTSIMGSLGLVRNMLGKAEPAKVETLIGIAHNNTERLLFLINDILDISKIESGHMVFHYKPLDVRELIEEVIRINADYKHDVSLRFVQAPGQAVWVHADRDRLLQVLNNLVSNAAKFSRAGSNVDLGVVAGEREVQLFVQDYGVGIPEAFKSRIFEKFTQADSSNTRHVGGTGLGLSITRSIVERHHGSIRFESEEGSGTTFFVTLPAHRVAVEADTTHADGPDVLICEDEPDIAKLLQQMLEQAGHRCDIARSAREAERMLEQRHYRAMTLDIMLPGKDGITFLRELRAQPRYQDLEVIIVSVKADEVRQQLAGSALGIQDWLGKPIDEQRLLAALRHLTPETEGRLPHILHIEDDHDLIQVVQSMLQGVARLGAATSLEQARRRLTGGEFDLVLLDINLPDGSGLDLLDQLQGSNTPVVVFSSEEVDATTLGKVAAVLQKTRADNARLVETIHTILGHHP